SSTSGSRSSGWSSVSRRWRARGFRSGPSEAKVVRRLLGQQHRRGGRQDGADLALPEVAPAARLPGV
ncbi:unnamed protein product, partial [Prorocentrum cordatum]